MNEKGVPPPPLLTAQSTQNISFVLPLLHKWLLRLQAAFPKAATYTVTFNPAPVAANSTSEQTVAVSGLVTTDIVYVNKPTHTAGLGVVNARVSATNTLAVTFQNVTAAPIDPPSEAYYVVAIRR